MTLMRNITIVGTGRVGLVTGVCLAEIGHFVTCFDINNQLINTLKSGTSPFYEPNLENLLHKNINEGRLTFPPTIQEALSGAEVIYITVGTPENEDGSSDLKPIMEAAKDIALNLDQDDLTIVIKSTVPVGTNLAIKDLIRSSLKKEISIDVVSNPEFLREGSAIYDTFYGDRIVIGADNERAAAIIEEINKPFNIPIVKTDIQSAEMIKYAANTFLATKISFINEVANICEKVGANIEEVVYGIGLDKRIGKDFLKPGIGFGGSCFPKDIQSLLQVSKENSLKGKLLESVLKVNQDQHIKLVEMAKTRFGSLRGKKVALLGLAFKPNTDDTRHSVALVIAKELVKEGAIINAYDPVAIENTKKMMGEQLIYTQSIETALSRAEMAFITTEWNEIKDFPLDQYVKLMSTSIIYDGWNCYDLEDVSDHGIEYYSIGRKPVGPTINGSVKQ
jgi:UDPglucose 6-dehydrogenase